MRFLVLCSTALLAMCASPILAEDKPGSDVYPVAIFPFSERGADVKDLGTQTSDLLFANLVNDTNLFLVDREDVKKMLDEQELNLSGLVNPDATTAVGHLTGAKILVTGSVLQSGDKLYLIAKIIGTETSRVFGAVAKGDVGDDLDTLAERLADDVAKTIKDKAESLVAAPRTRDDVVAALKKSLGKGQRPTVFIDIAERHVGQATLDPAAATEISLLCKELGFTVIDSQEGSKRDADLLIVGEGLSEFAARHGNLVSVKARLEIKAVERDGGRLVAVDRQVSVAVDLMEQIAGKSALQSAAAEIAERLLPKIVPGDKKEKKKENK